MEDPVRGRRRERVKSMIRFDSARVSLLSLPRLTPLDKIPAIFEAANSLPMMWAD